MRKHPKRILSLLLALVLCLGLLPMTALADWTNEGDLEDVRVITDNKGAKTDPGIGGNTDDLEDIRIITDNKGANSNPAPGGNEDEGDLDYIFIITDNQGSNTSGSGGSAEPAVQVHLTIDASPGKFTNGNTTETLTGRLYGNGNSIKVTSQNLIFSGDYTPVREGYTFTGWFTGDGQPALGVEFSTDTTFYAHWEEQAASGGGVGEGQRTTFELNANGGTVSPKTFTVEGEWGALKIVGKLPTPTRSGYTFKGWYIDGKLVDESKPITSSAPFPVAQWERIKITPAVSASPTQIEAGTEKVEVTLSCTTSGAMLDWRPFERLLFGGGKPADAETAVRQYINGNNPNGPSGLKLTDIRFEGSYEVDSSAYPYELYPQGVCPTPKLILTFEGKAVAGESLYIYMEPGCFVQPVTKNEHLVLTESSDQIFNSTKLSIPITGTVASANPNGPFTVKFDLNFADKSKEKASERPKAQTIAKGSAVSLPDGSKLTPPSDASEFYAWCVATKDEKGETVLFPWRESDAVTADMTLYAGWIRKGTVVKDGEGIKPVDSTGTSKPGGTTETVSKAVFADVVKSSPFAPAISWAVDKNITKGTSLTTFSPNNTCTRGHILTFLWRSQGSPEPTVVNPYKDEIPNAFQKAAVWAHEKGLVTGDTFGSSAPCTRASSVTYMWKLAGSPEAKAASFKDVAASSDYAKAVSWAVEQGVTNGTGDGTSFSPENTCTRGQIVTFLYRAYK